MLSDVTVKLDDSTVTLHARLECLSRKSTKRNKRWWQDNRHPVCDVRMVSPASTQSSDISLTLLSPSIPFPPMAHDNHLCLYRPPSRQFLASSTPPSLTPLPPSIPITIPFRAPSPILAYSSGACILSPFPIPLHPPPAVAHSAFHYPPPRFVWKQRSASLGVGGWEVLRGRGSDGAGWHRRAVGVPDQTPHPA